MISFKTILAEALNIHQRFYVDHYVLDAMDDRMHRPIHFSDHIFDEKSDLPGTATTGPAYPMSTTNDVRIMPFKIPTPEPSIEVRRFLTHHGYEIHDYEKGLAKRIGSTRPIRISQILNHKQPPPRPEVREGPDEEHLRDMHTRAKVWLEHDRELIKHNSDDGMEVMITRDPYHVAEQSTNKAWRSCMTLGSCPDMHDDMEASTPEQYERRHGSYERPGEFYHKIADDILSGTHIAYLIKKGDHKLKNPIARMSLKPFDSIDREGKERDHDAKQVRAMERNPSVHYMPPSWEDIKPDHSILRPVGQIYQNTGVKNFTLTRNFEKFLTVFTEKHFPMKPEHSTYKLDPNVQRDGNERRYLDNPEF